MPLTIAVIGESHADPLIGTTVRDAQTNEVLAVAQVVHVPGLLSTEFLDAAGRIHPRVVIALAALRFVIYAEDGQTDVVDSAIMSTNAYSPSWSPGWRVNSGWRGVPLMFMVGELSARAVIASVPPYADVEGPFAPEDLLAVPRFEPMATVSAGSIQAVVAAQLTPMFTVVRLLRDIGIGPIVLHSLAPPTPDDALYNETLGRPTRALTRYKVTLLFNAEMRAFAGRENFHFVDRWNDLTAGGVVREGYLRDAVHIANDYVRPSLLEVYRSLIPTERRLVV